SSPLKQTLLELCRSGEPEHQLDALRALKDLRDPSVISDILPLLSSPDDRVREAAAEALGELGETQPERVGAVLLPLLSDEVHLVRDQVVEILGKPRYQGAIEPLKGLLHSDPEWLVRASSAEALGNFADPSILPDLEQALEEDEEESVQG